jgi:hypothetical protein
LVIFQHNKVVFFRNGPVGRFNKTGIGIDPRLDLKR